MTGDPQAPGPEAERPYTVIFSRQARRNLRENLPLDVAAAAMETIDGPLTTNPHRVGKPLDEPFDGYHAARRGTYRIIYRINEDKHTVEIHSIRHRRDSYRALPQELPPRQQRQLESLVSETTGQPIASTTPADPA